jgi:hypothetical protein
VYYQHIDRAFEHDSNGFEEYIEIFSYDIPTPTLTRGGNHRAGAMFNNRTCGSLVHVFGVVGASW